MKLELKSIKVHPDMSEETNCFSATIYVDGKKAGTVSNDGRGGSHRYWWTDRDLHHQLEAWVATQPTEFEFEKLDQIVDKLLDKDEILKQLRRWTKKKTYFRLKGDKKNEWRMVNALFDPKVLAFLQNKYGDTLEIIANQDLEAAAVI